MPCVTQWKSWWRVHYSWTSLVQSLSHVQLFATPWTAAHRPPCSSPTPRVYSNPCPLSQWCHPAISSSVVPFSRLQSFPASGSFQMSQLFASGGQSIGVSTSASVLPMNTQDWSPFGWTGWISLQSKGLSRVFSNTIVYLALRTPRTVWKVEPELNQNKKYEHWVWKGYNPKANIIPK